MTAYAVGSLSFSCLIRLECKSQVFQNLMYFEQLFPYCGRYHMRYCLQSAKISIEDKMFSFITFLKKGVSIDSLIDKTHTLMYHIMSQ